MKKPAPQSKAYKTLRYLLNRETRLKQMKEYYHRTKEEKREHRNQSLRDRINRSPEHKAKWKEYQDRYHAEDWKEKRKLEKLRLELSDATYKHKKAKKQAEHETGTTGLTPETADTLALVTGILSRIQTQYLALKRTIEEKAKTRYVHNYKTIPAPADPSEPAPEDPKQAPEASNL